MGKLSYCIRKEEIKEGTYENTKYFYLLEDLVECSPLQRKAILKWAVDGNIKMPGSVRY